MAYQGYEGYGSPNLSARERAVLALLNRQRAAPKNIGEGINAIGESIGDRMIMDRMAREEAEGKARSQKAFEEYGRDIAPAAPVTAAAPSATPKPTFSPATHSAAPATPIEEGGYNIIDAQAGIPLERQSPGYLQDALQRNVRDPDMQAYLGMLSRREAPAGPASVSPTGASGPYQITRGTGRDYGVVGPGGDQRQDLDASTGAMAQFTADNAKIFERINGRPPTMAEMAVMHQQGGRTGAQMIAGTGNAPARNLAVNNIAPNASPQQAVAGIKGYYGLPDDPRNQAALTLSSRNRDPRLAAAMAATEPAPGVPPVNPTNAGGQPPTSGPAPSISATSAPGGQVPPNQQVAQAPQQAALPPGQGIRLAPPPQALQPPPVAVQPPPRAEPGRPPEAQMQPPTREEIAAQRYMSHPDPALAARANADFKRLYETREKQFTSDLIESRAAQRAWDQRQLEMPKRMADEAKAIADAAKAKAEGGEVARLGGMSPDIFTKEIGESQKVARTLPAAAQSIRSVRGALEAGVFSGSNAEVNLKLQKFLTGSLGMPLDPRISPTEQFTSYIANIVAQQRAALAGNANVSDADLKAGREAAGALITLEEGSKKKIIDHIETVNVQLATAHQGKINAFGKGADPAAAERLFGTLGIPMENIVPPGKVRQLHALVQDPATRAQALEDFDEFYQTPGLALRLLRKGPPK